ncbi:hypothetical protein AVCANL279_01025 [Campylobacter canadensis]|uniref:hypothetical protein n=1 Tax=Campylobacter canadensis TaxID=449520 RepID=UPI001554E564|nr:hypothetical protein [Campylobacter canadensis]MBZ7994086.1 hypothetical protein [Campylobacter canadensis]MBZ7995911.1 hypothetical protein [Campylobacter canadensis]MBZ7999417.1 hypothetical protein [Campylobacter canadensis]MBZ8001214.1 hypothetical protein [Campylobacter canadensis]MBZ8003743.1 hypothetical protein [Campylobacter canadensis]
MLYLINNNDIYNKTVYQKDNYESKSLNKQELSKLNNDILNNNLSFKTNEEQKYNTYFKLADFNVGVKLNEAALTKLQNFFDSDNFIKANDGGIILDKEAASYVAGWFSDIAINRNYLNADINKSGFIDKEEIKDLKLIVSAKYTNQSIDTLKADENSFTNYIKINDAIKSQDNNNFKYASSLDDLYKFEKLNDISKALSFSILKDANSDGIIKFNEYYENIEENNAEYNFAASQYNSYEKTSKSKISSKEDLEYEKKKRELEAAKALARLQQIMQKIESQTKLSNEDTKALELLNLSEDALKKQIQAKLYKLDEDTIDKINFDDFKEFHNEFIDSMQDMKILDIRV